MKLQQITTNMGIDMEKPKSIMIDDDKYVLESTIKQPPALSNRCVVRCKNAGVHVGTVKSTVGDMIVLANANRIWKWSGAFTLSEVAMNGVDRKSGTRIAVMIPEITLIKSDVCEIIPIAKGVDLTEVG